MAVKLPNVRENVNAFVDISCTDETGVDTRLLSTAHNASIRIHVSPRRRIKTTWTLPKHRVIWIKKQNEAPTVERIEDLIPQGADPQTRVSEGVFTLRDSRSFFGLTSKILPLGPMLIFDADVKKKRLRVTNVKTASVKRFPHG